jgi:hypothetical protein
LAKDLVDQALEAYAALGDTFAALAKLQSAQRTLC